MAESVYDQVEIEDMEYVKDSNKFYYPCPCGDRFEISVVLICIDSTAYSDVKMCCVQDELLDGEDIARCPSCSLILRVVSLCEVLCLFLWFLFVTGRLQIYDEEFLEKFAA